jgi:hypothetical protein
MSVGAVADVECRCMQTLVAFGGRPRFQRCSDWRQHFAIQMLIPIGGGSKGIFNSDADVIGDGQRRYIL